MPRSNWSWFSNSRPSTTVVPGQATGESGVSVAGGEQRRRGHRLHARAGREVAGQRVAGVGGGVRGDGEDLAGARPDDDQVGGQGLRRPPRRRRRSARPGRAASARRCPAPGPPTSISLPLVAGVLVGARHRDREARRCRRAAPGRPAAARTARAGRRRRTAASRPPAVSSMTSAVAAPTRPSRATAKRGEGASSRVAVGNTAPGRSKTWARIVSKSGRRRVMTGTNWPAGPPGRRRRSPRPRCPWPPTSAAASAGRSVTCAGSTPTLTTSVGREQRGARRRR